MHSGPKKGGRLLAAGPQSRIHRNGPFRKPARKRPRAFGGDGHAHSCPSTGLGGACNCQSRAESGVAYKPPVKKKILKMGFLNHHSPLLNYCDEKLEALMDAKESCCFLCSFWPNDMPIHQCHYLFFRYVLLFCNFLINLILKIPFIDQ